MKWKTPILVEIGIRQILEGVKDSDKLEVITLLVGSITEEGIIGPIREMVNDPIFDEDP